MTGSKYPRVLAECVHFEIHPEQRSPPRDGEPGRVTREREQRTVRTRVVEGGDLDYVFEVATRTDAMDQHVWHSIKNSTNPHIDYHRIGLLLRAARDKTVIVDEKPAGWVSENIAPPPAPPPEAFAAAPEPEPVEAPADDEEAP